LTDDGHQTVQYRHFNLDFFKATESDFQKLTVDVIRC
jgi:hypothetical protein